ncbi:MAG: methyltransferase domain-containing protein [Candidatus Aminicenantes bacterium]|nr:methyltransferase domain-containing protein [Candidatus Aminicenantes bacterium]
MKDILKKNIFEVNISLRFHSSGFLSGALSRIISDFELLKPKKIKLEISWSPSNLTLENRRVLRDFISRLKMMKIGIDADFPFCLPGWKDYEKIKRFTSFPDCDSCIFQEGNRCTGLIPSSYQELFDMNTKDFSSISLDDFRDESKPLTWWIPRSMDIDKIVRLAQFLHSGKGVPTILDVGCGQGFLAYLLARTERVKVIGIDPNERLIERTKFRHKNLILLKDNADSFLSNHQGSIDLAVSSFMPFRLDPTAQIKRMLRPKAVVYIQDKGIKQPGSWINLKISEPDNLFEYSLDKDVEGRFSLTHYYPFQRWPVPSLNDLKKERLYPLSSQIEIQIHKNIRTLPKLKAFSKERYGWEKELEFQKGKGKLTIGDMTLAFSSHKSIQVNHPYSSFISSRRSDIDIEVHSDSRPNFKQKRKVFDSEGPWKLYQVSRNKTAYSCDQNKLETVMVSDRHFKKVDFYSASKELRLENFFGYPLGEILIMNLLSQRGGLLVHSYGINDNGEGILFVGSSGAGKSTIASLRKDEEGTKILSDDRIILRQVKGRFWMYGTPWHGDIKVCSPEKAPLRKIFFLKKAKKNSVRKIEPIKAASRLIVCSFLTFWDKKGIESALEFIDELAREIPCYELGFKADKSAVDFVSNI